MSQSVLHAIGAPREDFDAAAVLALVEGDRALLAELVEMCRTETPGLLDEIRERMAGDDHQGLARAAHRLRGTLATFGAGPACRLAGELESAARAGTLDAASERVMVLAAEVRSLEDGLLALLSTVAA